MFALSEKVAVFWGILCPILTMLHFSLQCLSASINPVYRRHLQHSYLVFYWLQYYARYFLYIAYTHAHVITHVSTLKIVLIIEMQCTYPTLECVCTFSGHCHCTVIFSEALLLARTWCMGLCCVWWKWNLASGHEDRVGRRTVSGRCAEIDGCASTCSFLRCQNTSHRCCLYTHLCCTGYPSTTCDHRTMGVIKKCLLSSGASLWSVCSIGQWSGRGKGVSQGAGCSCSSRFVGKARQSFNWAPVYFLLVFKLSPRLCMCGQNGLHRMEACFLETAERLVPFLLGSHSPYSARKNCLAN